jgi:PAS domain S-box-containing protein
MTGTREPPQRPQAWLEGVLETMEVGLYSVSADLASVLYVNPAAAVVFGRSLDELRSQPRLCIEAIAPGEAAFVGDPVAEALETGRSRHIYRIRRPEGDERWVLAQWHRGDAPDGRAESLDGVFTDITYRMNVEQALRESRERLSLVTNNMVDAVLQIDADMHVVYASPSADLLCGVAPEAAVGLSLFDCLHEDDGQDIALMMERQIAARADALPIECRLRAAAGQGRWVEGRLRLLYDGERFAGAVVGLRDVTDRRRAQEALRTLPERILRAQEDERRALARELHDSALQDLASLKLRLGEWSAAAEAARPEIEARLFSHVDGVIEDLRTLATRLRPSILDDLGLVPALRSYVTRRADEGRLAAYVDAELPGGRLAPELETNCFRIVQEAVANVVAHAQAKRLFVQVHCEGESVVLSVRDDGRGFAAEERLRAAEEGHFGLSAIEERAASMGGRVEIASAKGSGTEIVARMPYRARAARSQPPAAV